MQIGNLMRRIGACATAAIAVGGLSVFTLAGPAGAAGPGAGSSIPNSATCASSCAAAHPYSSGQVLNITVPANSTLASLSGSPDQIEECQFFGTSLTPPSGGFPSSDFPSGANAANECDALTLQGTSSINADGSFTDTVQVFALPDPNFESTSPIQCDLGHICVFYLGTNASSPNGAQNFWSQPFYVNPNGGSDAGANPGDGTPEVPLAVGLPLLAMGLIGGTVLIRRRRNRSVMAGQ